MGRKTSTRRKAKPGDTYTGFEPTPEQQAKGEFIQGGNLATASNERAGLAYRRKPVIDVLRDEHKLTQRQYDGLARYRTVALVAERSELKSCIDFSVRGNGEDRRHFGLRMNIELGRLEQDLRGLLHISRAVAVQDETLSSWAVRQSGGKERLRGAVTAIEPSSRAFNRAWLDLRMAGEWLAAAIGA